MVLLHTLAENLGRYCEATPFVSQAVLKKVALESGQVEEEYELLPLFGAKTGHILPVLHGLNSRRLLLWSPSLTRTVDLAKIRPEDRQTRNCHQTMLEYSKTAYERLRSQYPYLWSEDLARWTCGGFSTDWCQKMAEMVGKIHLAQPVEQAVFHEMLTEHYSGALV